MMREHGFAARLREWRQRRGWSQLDLAARADISQRHLSFLELARAAPSRDMVLRLATALDIPLRQHNALLLAAGFAPVWQETDLGAPGLAEVRHAIDYILAQQEPFPAVAVDRHWNLLKANDGAVRLVEFLVGPLAPDAKVNLADALVGPDVLRPFLLNWADVVGYYIRSVEADAAADGRAETAAFNFGLMYGLADARMGENVSYGTYTDGDAMRQWKNSPGHNANLLLPGATRFGIAIAQSYGRVYWAMAIASEPVKAVAASPFGQGPMVRVRRRMVSPARNVGDAIAAPFSGLFGD